MPQGPVSTHDRPAHDDVARLQREHALFLRLLGLESGEPEAFLRDALDVAAHAARAERGYLAVFDPELDDDPHTPRWSTSRGVTAEQVTGIEQAISHGIVAESLATGTVVRTRSAASDPRFSARASVRSLQIEAVLSVPIGRPARGVLYLQGVGDPAGFTAEDERLTVLVAHHLAPRVDELLLRERALASDPTAAWRTEGRFRRVAGRSAALARVFRDAVAAARGTEPVLLTGPTGVGKTALAKELHELSGRTGKFLRLNCPAVPESLFDAHLFGAAQGTWTGLDSDRDGLLVAAQGGTLLLDEISEIPLVLQAKLLEILDEGTFTPLGETEPVTADVRILAATNTDLEAEVAAGRFREDLYHRLDVFRLHLPALATRPEDVPEIVDLLGRRHASASGVPWPGVTPSALLRLQVQAWPGNVRELENRLRKALALTQGTRPLDEGDLLADEGVRPLDGDGPTLLPLNDAMARYERAYLIEAIRQADGSKTRAATALGISRATLYEHLKALGIDPSSV